MKEKFFEIIDMIRDGSRDEELVTGLRNFHDNDICDLIRLLTRQERERIYHLLGIEKTAQVLAYFREPGRYFDELTLDTAAAVLSKMEPDDAVDVLEQMEPQKRRKILERLEPEAVQDVRLLLSYRDDQVGSCMTTNYIGISAGLTVRQAMSEVVQQAGVHDNIMTIYVVNQQRHLVGAIDLKDLITAREGDDLNTITVGNYPCLQAQERIQDCMGKIVDYAEDSIPVLSEEGRILGVITAEDLVEIVDREMGEDYVKLAGLSKEEEPEETTGKSVAKRLPWLMVLLFLGMIVSTVVGMFEGLVAVVPIVICFQSLVLDMAGNVGTQSLAVTIRFLMDQKVTGTQKLGLLWRETKIGFINGGLLGGLSLIFLGIYIHFTKGYDWLGAFAVSGCVGISLLVAMMVSSLFGTLIPMFFHKIHVDPAVASGPLITTVNDLVAVVTYYGLVYFLLIP